MKAPTPIPVADETAALREEVEALRQHLAEYVDAAVERHLTIFDVRRCRVCGCTDDDCSGCIERTGRPCWWVEHDLCSACQE